MPSPLRIPAVLRVATLAAAASCSSSPSPDVTVTDAADVAAQDGGPGCSTTMPGFTCYTTCNYLGAGGLEPRPCEVYCSPTVTYCNGPNGQISPDACMLSGAPDGGQYIFC